jgi:hypothetical protein
MWMLQLKTWVIRFEWKCGFRQGLSPKIWVSPWTLFDLLGQWTWWTSDKKQIASNYPSQVFPVHNLGSAPKGPKKTRDFPNHYGSYSLYLVGIPLSCVSSSHIKNIQEIYNIQSTLDCWISRMMLHMGMSKNGYPQTVGFKTIIIIMVV